MLREGFYKIVSSPSKTFLTFCCFLILSSGLASLINFTLPKEQLLFIIYLLISVLIISWHKKIHRFLLLLIIIIFAGLFRYSISVPECSEQICGMNGKNVSFFGKISAEPDQRTDRVYYQVAALESLRGNSIGGKVQVKSSLYPIFKYGDEVKISCQLEPVPTKAEIGFHYDKYLARAGIYSICQNLRLTKVGESADYRAYIYIFKNELNSRIGQLWQEPYSSLMSGILYGGRSGLPKYVTENFSRTGVSHIMAVSGFNITILVMFFMYLALTLGMYRQNAFYFTLIFTFLFVVFSGFSASAVRAGIMGMAVLFAKHIGRKGQMLNVLFLTVALMQMINPFYLFWDIGFQLSLLATLGLVAFSQREEKEISKLKETIVSTIWAITLTFPLILFQFGTFSLVAPLSNLLVLWIVPYLMLFGALALAGSYIFSFLGTILALVAHLGLSYVIMIVEFFGKKSWSSFQFHITIWEMFLIYGLLITLYFRNHLYLWVREKSK